MSPIERQRIIDSRKDGHATAKRVKHQLAATVDTLIMSQPKPNPERMVVSTPLQMKDVVSNKLALLILRTHPEEVTDRMTAPDYTVTISLDQSLDPPLIVANVESLPSVDTQKTSD